jgi:Domain of unknown function (DUF4333)
VRGRGARSGLGGLAAVVATLALVACSPDKQVDTDRAEAEIKQSLSTQTGDPVQSVRCPDEVKAKQGERFRCVATVSDGSRVRIVVTQTDDDGGVRWSVLGR